MNEALENLIKKLEKQLESTFSDIEWYQKKIQQFNEEAINLKITITELKAVSAGMP